MKNATNSSISGLLLAVSLLLSSCFPATPQARIERNPEKFNALPAAHQELVKQGQIDSGMSQDAVYLAWGTPSRTFQGQRKNQMTERWDYAATEAVPVYGSYGMYGNDLSPYGPYGPPCQYGHLGRGYHIGSDFTYVPYRVASVWFTDRKLDSWERVR